MIQAPDFNCSIAYTDRCSCLYFSGFRVLVDSCFSTLLGIALKIYLYFTLFTAICWEKTLSSACLNQEVLYLQYKKKLSRIALNWRRFVLQYVGAWSYIPIPFPTLYGCNWYLIHVFFCFLLKLCVFILFQVQSSGRHLRCGYGNRGKSLFLFFNLIPWLVVSQM